METFISYRQLEPIDNPLVSLQIIAAHYGRQYSLITLRKKISQYNYLRIPKEWCNAAQSIGLLATAHQITLNKLLSQTLPCVIQWKNRQYAILYKIEKPIESEFRHYFISDPEHGLTMLPENIFKIQWAGHCDNGVCIQITPNSDFNRIISSTIIENPLYHVLQLFQQHFSVAYKRSVLFIILLVLFNIFWAIIPIFLQHFIDNSSMFESYSLLVILFAIQIIALFCQNIVAFFFQSYYIRIVQKLHLQIKNIFFQKVLSLPLNYLNHSTHQQYLQSLHQQNNHRVIFIDNLLLLIAYFPTFIILLSLLFYYNHTIYGIFMILNLIVWYWHLSKTIEQQKNSYALNILYNEQQQLFDNSLANINDLKIYQAEKNYLHRYQQLQQQISQLETEKQKQEQNTNLFFNSLHHFNLLFSIGLATYYYLQQQGSIGTIVVIAYLVAHLNAILKQGRKIIANIIVNKHSIDQINHIQQKNNDTNPQQISPPKLIKEGIRLKNVYFKYTNSYSSYTLNNISLLIPKNKTTLILGEIGSGKTTLLHLLICAYYCDKGEVLIDYVNYENINPEQWRKLCGVVMPNGYVVNGTVEENIIFGDENPNRQRLEEAYRKSCLYQPTSTLSLELDDYIDSVQSPLTNLQRIKILLARLFYKNPTFVFLDDICNTIDLKSEPELCRNLKNFCEYKTVVIFSDKKIDSLIPDQTIFLHNGQIIKKPIKETVVIPEKIEPTFYSNNFNGIMMI